MAREKVAVFVDSFCMFFKTLKYDMSSLHLLPTKQTGPLTPVNFLPEFVKYEVFVQITNAYTGYPNKFRIKISTLHKIRSWVFFKKFVKLNEYLLCLVTM